MLAIEQEVVVSPERHGRAAAAAPPEVNLGVLLFVAYRAMENEVIEALAAAGFDDVTLAQARVFQRIDAGGSRLTDLAKAAQITKQSAGFLVDQLEHAGYVERRPDPQDGRARLICVAERGGAAVSVGAGVIADIEARWKAHLGAPRMAQLRGALTDLRQITDPYA